MSQNVAPPAAGRPQTPALVVLFSVVFINLVGFGLVVPLLPFFAATLDAAPWQITLMFSAYSLGQFFAEPFWGRLSDRIGRKPVLLITLAANAAGYLALAFAPDIWSAVAIRLFTGLGAGNISTVQGYVADVTPPERRAGRMGLIGAAFGLGFIVGPGLGGLLTQPQLGHVGYMLPIFTAAGLAALAAVGVAVFLKESRAKADPAAPRPAFLSGLSEARANPVVSRVLLVTLIYMAGFSAMESVFGLWAEARYAWGAREVGLSFMIVGVVSALNQGVFAGRLARRFGEARVLTIGMLMFGASLVLQVIAPTEWFPALRLDLGLFTLPLPQGVGHSAGDDPGSRGDVPGHAQHLGPDLARHAAGPPGGDAGTEHGVGVHRPYLRPHVRRRPVFRAGPRLALPGRRRPDRAGGHHGGERRTGGEAEQQGSACKSVMT